MRKIITISVFFTIGFYSNYNAQNAPQTKFFRPSMTSTYIKSSDSQVEKIYGAFKNLPMEARFDNRLVSNNSLNVNMPAKPVMPTSDNPLELKKMMDNYKKAVQDWNTLKEKELNAKLSGVARDVISNMFGRDAQGNLSYAKIMEAAAYSATDGQALSAGASENKNNIYTEIAEELLKRGYVVAYDVKSLETYEQSYNKADASAQALAAKSGKPATPVKRTSEGWIANFDYSIYRLVWNDSISTIFYTQVWLDENVTDPAVRAQKKSAFDSFNFPLELMLSGSNTAISSQSNDAAFYEKTKIKRKSMDELITELPIDMQNSMVSKGGRKIEDFKMRAPIFQESPVSVKLGTKEGLYYDERFFVYEIVTDKKGNKEKKRVGILRSSKIVDNSIVAAGTSPASTFRQEGGKRLYQGSLVELKEDFGLGFNLGYIVSDPLAGGMTLGAEIRIPKLLKGSAGWNKYLRGIYLNANVSIGSFSDQKLNVEDASYYYNINKSSGSTMAFGASLSRETYFLKKGNLYVMPEIGAGLFSASLTELEGTAPVGGINMGSLYVNGGLGLGFHFTPMISVFAKAGFNMKIGEPGFTNDAGEELDLILSVSQNNSSVFSKARGLSTPISAGLRFRF